jgi:hypothetical protein
MSLPPRMIPVDSLAAWWAQWDPYECVGCSHAVLDHTHPPTSLLEKNAALFDRVAALELPDGRRYGFAPAQNDELRDVGGLTVKWLEVALVEHGCIRHGRVLRPSDVMLDTGSGSLSLRTAWCLECSAFVDLEQEMVEAKRMEAAGEIALLESLDDEE